MGMWMGVLLDLAALGAEYFEVHGAGGPAPI